MKIPARIIGRGWVLAAVFTAALCGADVVCLWAGNTPASSDANAPSEVPCLDGAGNTDAPQGQIQGGVNCSTKENAENEGFLYADVSKLPPGSAGPTDNRQAESENSDSSFDRYLLIVLGVGTLGLVLIAAGIAQSWRRRSVQQYWLFPVAQDDGELAAQGTLSPPLIAKKPMETLPEEKIDKHAQRRAA